MAGRESITHVNHLLDLLGLVSDSSTNFYKTLIYLGFMAENMASLHDW